MSPFRYNKILDLFPELLKDKPDMDYSNYWENSNSLSTLPGANPSIFPSPLLDLGTINAGASTPLNKGGDREHWE